MPRIISGKARGTHLVTPKGDKTRPTADKVKEALFSILAPVISDAVFLDLYSGSGQIALEALSRGAAKAYMIEQNRYSLDCIKTNIEKTGLTEQTFVMRGSVSPQLKNLLTKQLKFDLIYIDPPWDQAEKDFMKISVLLSDLIAENGWIILEHDSRQQLPEVVTKLKCFRRCQYGSAMLSFYQLEE